MLKSYKYKLSPNEEQKILLNKHFGSIRFAYNYFLNERKKEYETNNQSLNYYDNARELTELKKQEEYSWLNEINSQSLQVSLKHLDDAYNGFFKKRTGFPKFKSKHTKNSFKVPQFVKLINGKLKIPKFDEPIDVIFHRSFSGKIKQCTQQHLNKKTKGSSRYELQKLKVAKLHKKITNSRLDNLHKVSTELIKKYDTIILEDLNIKGMIKNHKLSKHISDASWSKFIELLSYKAQWNDKNIVKIDRFFPSSKTCNCCGYINQNLDLSVREWTCPSCNTKLDRDLNASKNILNEGYKLISSGIDDYRSRGEIRPTLVGTTDETSKILNIFSEAQPSLVVG